MLPGYFEQRETGKDFEMHLSGVEETVSLFDWGFEPYLKLFH